MQFPQNLGLLWMETAAKRLRLQFPRVTGGPAGSQCTGYRLAEEPNIEGIGRRPWSRNHVQQRGLGISGVLVLLGRVNGVLYDREQEKADHDEDDNADHFPDGKLTLFVAVYPKHSSQSPPRAYAPAHIVFGYHC